MHTHRHTHTHTPGPLLLQCPLFSEVAAGYSLPRLVLHQPPLSLLLVAVVVVGQLSPEGSSRLSVAL